MGKTHEKHREVLINALVEHDLDTSKNEEFLADVLRRGHRGYESYLDIELLDEAENRVLRRPDVQAAIDYLRRLYEE